MMSDYLTATVAGSVAPAATERPATVGCRELSSAHTLADNHPQLFFVHKVQSPEIARGTFPPTHRSSGLALHNNYF
jgi:hypothetical protein